MYLIVAMTNIVLSFSIFSRVRRRTTRLSHFQVAGRYSTLPTGADSGTTCNVPYIGNRIAVMPVTY